MHLYISTDTIYYNWRLYDDRKRLVSRSHYGSGPKGIELQIRPLLDAFEGTHPVHFHYDTLRAAKEVGMVLGGEEEVRRAIIQTKDEIAKRKEQRRRESAEWHAKRRKIFFDRVKVAFWLIVFIVVIAKLRKYQ